MNDQNQRVYMGNDDAGNPIYGEYVGSDAVGNPIFGVFQGYDAYKQPVFSGICGQDEQGRPIWDTMGFNEQGQLVYGIPAVYDVNGNPLPQPAEQAPGGFTEAGKDPGKVRPRLHITPLMVVIMLAVIGLTAWFCYEQFAPQAARFSSPLYRIFRTFSSKNSKFDIQPLFFCCTALFVICPPRPSIHHFIHPVPKTCEFVKKISLKSCQLLDKGLTICYTVLVTPTNTDIPRSRAHPRRTDEA